MLSSECVFLLNYIKNSSKNGYFVEDVSAISLEFPPFYKMSEEKALENIDLLKKLGYVSVKYNDGDKVCAMITERGDLYLQSLIGKGEEVGVKSTFAWSFFGGLIGGFLGAVVALALRFFTGG